MFGVWTGPKRLKGRHWVLNKEEREQIGLKFIVLSFQFSI